MDCPLALVPLQMSNVLKSELTRRSELQQVRAGEQCVSFPFMETIGMTN